ncbi:MAG: TetR/AcrR family transcriptional regulator [Granulosicoccus sp.]
MNKSGAKRKPLHIEAVIDGAVRLADQHGVEPLTIRKLATHLGVKPMAIYHHVSGKEAILDGMVDRVFSEIELPPDDVDWRTGMRVRAHSARAVFARHHWAASMMDSRNTPGPATLRHHDAVLRCLRSGLSLTMAAHAYALIDAFIFGFALTEAALPAENDEELTELATDILDGFEEDAYPHLTELTVNHILQPGYSFGAEFDFGLDLILEGLASTAQRKA